MVESVSEDLHPDIRSAIGTAEAYNLAIVDAVAITWYTGQSSPELQMLEDAIMIRGKGAVRLWRSGF